MSILKRALLYVSRKWRQSIIILLVLIAVCTSTLMGFAVLKASDLAAANLRRQFGGNFSMEIDKSNPANMQNAGGTEQYSENYYVGEFLNQAVIDEVMKTSGISEYSASIESVANLKSADGEYFTFVENNQTYHTSFHPYMARIQGWTSLQQCSYFANHILEVTQGEMFTKDASGQAVISRQMAELNRIEIGDKLTLEINSDITGFAIPLEKQDWEFEIVGIFDIRGEQQVNQFMNQRQLMENWIFVDAGSLLLRENEILEAIGERPIGYNEVTFRVTDPVEMDSIVRGIQENKAIDWSCFKIKIDNSNYLSAENALKSMDGGIHIMILAIAAAGIGLLILLLSIWARSRIYETGILLSVGESKGGVLAQRIAEVMLITVLAFGVSFVCGNITAKDVGSILLARANEKNTDETMEDPLGFNLPASSESLTPVFSDPEVEEINVVISADILAAAYGLELTIIILSVVVSGLPVLNMQPRAILTKCV